MLEALTSQNKTHRRFSFLMRASWQNAMEDILLDREDVAFFCRLQFPAYPGSGGKNVGKNCFNYPVAPSAPRETYRATLARALAELKNFSPDLIAVSAGFDAYARDPLADGTSLAEYFHWLGQNCAR